VEPWNPHVGAKAKIEAAWFRVSGLPMEKRSEKRICYVASLVGIPLEVDKANLKRWEYVRVKIGCKDITKVPAVVEGLLDMHFYDFVFQREVQESYSKQAWNTWTRTTERGDEDNPSPKKHKKGDEKGSRGVVVGKMILKLVHPRNSKADNIRRALNPTHKWRLKGEQIWLSRISLCNFPKMIRCRLMTVKREKILVANRAAALVVLMS
jgi:hypothetical protein